MDDDSDIAKIDMKKIKDDDTFHEKVKHVKLLGPNVPFIKKSEIPK